jgi:hypothetical protein
MDVATTERTEARTGPAAGVVVGVYAWIATISFGAVLLDVVYGSRATAGAAEAADFLLLLQVAALATGLAATAAAWSVPAARNLLVASLGLIVLGLAGGAILSGLPTGLEPGSGAPLRLLIHGAASALALTGWRQFPRG